MMRLTPEMIETLRPDEELLISIKGVNPERDHSRVYIIRKSGDGLVMTNSVDCPTWTSVRVYLNIQVGGRFCYSYGDNQKIVHVAPIEDIAVFPDCSPLSLDKPVESL